MSTVLVVGGAGYIGSHIVRELLRAGHTPIVYDNFSTGHTYNIPQSVLYHAADIRNEAALQTALQGVDAVIHLAALKAAGDSETLFSLYSEVNLIGSLTLLNACLRAGVHKLIFSSSAAVYGEPMYVPIDESHRATPSNFYGFTKLAIEQLLEQYARRSPLEYVSLRYFNAAGYDEDAVAPEEEVANLLPIVMETALSRRSNVEVYGTDYPTHDGTGIRDYVHVSDLAAAHIAALEYLTVLDHLQDSTSRFHIFNLGSEQGYSVFEVIGMVESITQQQIPYTLHPRRAGDPAIVVAEFKRAQSILGWTPQYSSLENIVESMWRVYKKDTNERATI